VLAYEQIGTKAVAARTLAGIAEGTPVFCLPGNPDAARLALAEIILPEATGIVELTRTGTGVRGRGGYRRIRTPKTRRAPEKNQRPRTRRWIPVSRTKRRTGVLTWAPATAMAAGQEAMPSTRRPSASESGDDLEESGEARFPFPPHGRIPNFAGASDAADRLAEQPEWKEATTIKANPDAPQLPVRRRALHEGKTVYMAVPRLRDERCFLKLDPDELEDYDAATTVSGSSKHGEQVGPEAIDRVDLIVSGSVAVTEEGGRIGKGEGYSDLEYAVLRNSVWSTSRRRWRRRSTNGR